MADVFDPATRSAVMARVRSTGNASTELRLIAIMKAHGLRGWRRNVRLAGRPDFVFRAARVVVFVDGCFWHGCRKCGRLPATRVEYWAPKIARNQRRDRSVTRALRAAGWVVLRLPECALRDGARVARRLMKLLQPLSERPAIAPPQRCAAVALKGADAGARPSERTAEGRAPARPR